MFHPRILIVEDTPEDLDLLATLLQERNYEVHTATDAGMAIESVQSKHPDLILLDLILPDLSGYEVCQYIKSQENLKHIPVVFIDSLEYSLINNIQKERIFECGGSDYITKPFLIPEVMTRIENLLKIKQLESQVCLDNQQINPQSDQGVSSRQQVDRKILMTLLQTQELNHLRSQFITIISHEFKTPLTTIQLATDLLSHYPLTPEQREVRYQQIKSSIFYMNSLLENTIFTEQLNNNAIDLSFKSVEIRSFFQNVIDPFKNTLSSAHELIVNMEETTKEIIIETNLLYQIISNLVSNAIKYSPKGGKIWIDLTFESGQMIFKIKDEGIGILQEDQHQLFELFSRGSNISTIRGAGLGLAIVYRAVELLEGELTFTSAVGMGTEFRVTLPYRELFTASP